VGLFGRGEFNPLETVIQIGRKFNRKKTRTIRRVKGFSDHLFEIIGAFLAGPEKTPTEVNWAAFISF